LWQQINKIIGLQALYPTSLFLLVKITKSGLSSLQLKKRLAQRGILIREGETFRGLGKKFFRVGIRTYKDNLQLIKNLKIELKVFDRI